MTGVLDVHAAKVNRQDIECGIGRSLEQAGQTSGERIGPVCGHGIYHQTVFWR